MLKSMVIALVAAVAMLMVAAPARAADLRLGARLDAQGMAVRGSARYEERPRGASVQQRFRVEIQNATAGAQFTVTVKGQILGVVTANSFGKGELTLRVNSDDPGTGTPSLPHMAAGTVVSVGPISGALRPQ